MKNKSLSLIFILLLFTGAIQAQVEKVIVETYYVTDSIDATDTDGGIIEAGTTTYRVFIDLAPGTRLKRIYGDTLHAMKISSTAKFFNNNADGQSFGKDFSRVRYSENTVALDSWLTIGQTTRAAAKTYFGVLKTEDTDGSFIGGINNDGGSAGISYGLLTNTDPAAGIPLTTADGMDTIMELPSSWGSYGIIDSTSLVDSTIFGSAKTVTALISHNAGLQCSGMMGVDPDSNQVLVAQLTTKGDLAFELNIEVDQPDGGSFKNVRYVAQGHDTTYYTSSHVLITEKLCPSLTYPPLCGCIDPHFLEYSKNYACSNPGACHTPIILGCLDTMACNYDPTANYNVPELCCYPGHCSDRDISFVCPELNHHRSSSSDFSIYPNPANDQLTIRVPVIDHSSISFEIYDAMGKIIYEKKAEAAAGIFIQHLDVSGLRSGLYHVRLAAGTDTYSNSFMKY